MSKKRVCPTGGIAIISRLRLRSKQVLLSATAVIVSLILLISLVALPVWAEEPQPGEKPQLAPVNPEFEAYRQNPPEEFYGYIPPPMDLSHLKDIPVERAHLKGVPTEESFDWRSNNKVTPVKDQNPCGTCWVFGTLAAVESKVLVGESVSYDFSEQNLVCCTDPSWVYLDNNRCNGGGWSWLAADTLSKKGTRLEACNPYNTGTINTETCNDTCTTIKYVTGYRLVTDEQSQTDLIKEAVYDHGPVTMAFYYSASHIYTDATYGTVYDYYPSTGGANHLVSIIGWDDAVPHPSPGHSGTGAWLVKNSWGTGWGNSGYFWLAYDSSCMCEIAYLEYGDYNSNVALLYWDEAGWVTSAGYTGSDYAWMANVFTAGQAGSLTHVDFWATSNNAGYEIHVYNDGNPLDGLTNELASKSGTCAEAGYYSIELTSPVSLTASQDFTIAVKMTTPSYNYPIPIEYVETGTCEPPIQAGVSFISSTGSTWTDMESGGDNACLRARILEETLVSVNISPASVAYGTLDLGTTGNTVAGQTITITNDGNVTEDFKIKSSDALRDGGTPWTLASSKDANEFTHEFSTSDGSSWTTLYTTPTPNDYVSLATGIAASGGTQTFDLQITMPSSADDCGEHTITITILAVASGS